MALISKEAFKKTEGKRKRDLLDHANPHLDGQDFNADTTTVLSYEPSFYPGYKLLEITDREQVPYVTRIILFGEKKKDVVVLDWTSAPIYALNERLPIDIDVHNVSAYVRFFFQYVKGAKGSFIIVESSDDMKWKDDPTPAGRKALGDMLEPLQVTDEKDGGFTLAACFAYRGSLFSADIRVDKIGQVMMQNEELLIEKIPVMDDLLGQ